MAFPDQPAPKRTRKSHSDQVHEEAERIAVSTFDWVAEPINGMIEAAIAAAPHRHHHEAHGSDQHGR